MQQHNRLITAALLLLCSPALFAAADTCPPLASISRTSGEYSWHSTDGRWEGYFVLPRVGRGSSNQVVAFQEARWIQLTDLRNSSGVVECDYAGNSPGEIIRFISNIAMATPKPTGNQWSCEFNPDIPGTQCLCGGEALGCQL